MNKKRRVATAVIAIAGGFTSVNCQWDLGVLPEAHSFECEDVEDGRTLAVEATLADTTLTLEITHEDRNASWDEESVAITKPVNVLAESSPSIGHHLLSVSVQLTSAMVTSGAFTFSGTLEDGYETSCDVTRDFTFTIDGAAVTIE